MFIDFYFENTVYGPMGIKSFRKGTQTRDILEQIETLVKELDTHTPEGNDAA